MFTPGTARYDDGGCNLLHNDRAERPTRIFQPFLSELRGYCRVEKYNWLYARKQKRETLSWLCAGHAIAGHEAKNCSTLAEEKQLPHGDVARGVCTKGRYSRLIRVGKPSSAHSSGTSRIRPVPSGLPTPTAGRSETTAKSAVRNAPRSSSSGFPTPSRKTPPGNDIRRSGVARQALPASVGCSVAHPSRQSRGNLHNADGVGRWGRVRCARLSRPSSRKAWSRA